MPILAKQGTPLYDWVETLITQLKISLKLTFCCQPQLLASLPNDSDRTACTSSAMSWLPRQQVQSECMHRQGKVAWAQRLGGQEAGKMEERHPISWVSTQRGTLYTFMQLSAEDLWTDRGSVFKPPAFSDRLRYDTDFCQGAIIAAVSCSY